MRPIHPATQDRAYSRRTVGWSSVYDADPGATMDVRARVLIWHTGLLLRRENRRRRARLRRELSSYTPRELLDLEAAIERYPLGQTRELRTMLACQRQRETWSHRPFAA